MYLLDTNICIYFMKNIYPDLTEKLLSLDPSSLLISSVTVFELEYGAEKSNWGEKNRQKLSLFLAPFNIIPFTVDDAVIAGRIRGYLGGRPSALMTSSLLLRLLQGTSLSLHTTPASSAVYQT